MKLIQNSDFHKNSKTFKDTNFKVLLYLCDNLAKHEV